MSDWRTITSDDVLEGTLIEWLPNRMRQLDSGAYQIELHVQGPRARVRLPFPEAYNDDVLTEPNEWHGSGDNLVIDSLRRRWFERNGDETHMLIEVIA